MNLRTAATRRARRHWTGLRVTVHGLRAWLGEHWPYVFVSLAGVAYLLVEWGVPMGRHAVALWRAR